MIHKQTVADEGNEAKFYANNLRLASKEEYENNVFIVSIFGQLYIMVYILR